MARKFNTSQSRKIPPEKPAIACESNPVLERLVLKSLPKKKGKSSPALAPTIIVWLKITGVIRANSMLAIITFFFMGIKSSLLNYFLNDHLFIRKIYL